LVFDGVLGGGIHFASLSPLCQGHVDRLSCPLSVGGYENSADTERMATKGELGIRAMVVGEKSERCPDRHLRREEAGGPGAPKL
jgi:hypothetical protein